MSCRGLRHGSARDRMQVRSRRVGFFDPPRPPPGTLAGVSGFQLQFSSDEIYTPGDRLNALIAMNPAALRKSLQDLEPGGILIVNNEAFGDSDLRKAGVSVNPLEDGSLKGYR